MKHIGIVAVSTEGAALCYRTICLEGAALLGPHAHPEVSLHNFPLSEYQRLIDRDEWPEVGAMVLESATRLVRAGAQILICPDNTIHQGLDLVRERSPAPWIHIAEEVTREAARRQFKRVGILGTRFLMEGPVYPSRLTPAGIEYRTPNAGQRERINQIIYDELVRAQFLPDVARVLSAGHSRSRERRLRRGRARMHRDPAAHRRDSLFAPDSRLDPHHRPRGPARRDANRGSFEQSLSL